MPNLWVSKQSDDAAMIAAFIANAHAVPVSRDGIQVGVRYVRN